MGHEETSGLAVYEVISPKFHDTSLLERFAESESGEIDDTVGRLTRQCAESLRNVRNSVLPSSTLGRETGQYNWDHISEAASFRLSQHIKATYSAGRETTRNAR